MIAISTALLAALLSVAVGLPWAAWLRRSEDDLVDLLSDSVAIGLMFVVTSLSVFSWIGVPGLGACLVLEAGVVALLVRRRGPLFVRARPARADVLWAVALGVILVGALALRRHPSAFVEYTGDMGAYPTWAGQFLRTGSLFSTWPPAFSMLLALGGLLTGAEGVTAIVPVTGLVLVVVIVRLLRLVGAGRPVALLGAAVVAVHPAAIWFSRIPLSESLSAPLMVLWLIAFVGALHHGRRQRLGWTLVGALTMLALSLVRGTAPLLLLPIVLLAVGAALLPRTRARAPALAGFASASGVSAVIGYWYGIDRITEYYVSLQLREILPGGLFGALGRAGLLEVGPVSALAAAGLVLVLLAGCFLLAREAGRATGQETGRETRIVGRGVLDAGRATRLVEAGSGLLLVAVVAQSAVGHTDVWQILGRLGLGLVGAALAAPFLVALTRHSRDRGVLVIVSTLLASLFVELQIARLHEVRPHIVHLYWDRYLFSEFFPLMVVLVGVGLVAIGDIAKASLRPRVARGVRVVALPAAGVAMVVGILPETALIGQKTLLQGASRIQSELVAALPDRGGTVVWGASAPGSVAGSGFPNTWQAFGVPLALADGYRIDTGHGKTADGTLPDVVLDAGDLARASACSRELGFSVVESELPGGQSLPERIDPGEFRVERVDRIRQDVVQLPQPAPDGWTTAHYVFDVYRVTPAAGAGAFSPKLCADRSTR